MVEILKVGDVLEIQWATDSDSFICPICGYHQFCPGYADTTLCENCWSSFEEVNCIRITEVGKVKHNVHSKLDVISHPKNPTKKSE